MNKYKPYPKYKDSGVTPSPSAGNKSSLARCNFKSYSVLTPDESPSRRYRRREQSKNHVFCFAILTFKTKF
jgi:hypothetical protein